MYQKKTVECHPAPEALAAHNALPGLPGERQIKKSRLKQLTLRIAQGKFHSVDWHHAIDRKTGIEYRADGQHTGYLLANLDGLKFPSNPDGTPITATITTWEMDDVTEDGLDLFDMFNAPFSVRSNQDYVGIVKMAHADLRNIANKHLVNCLSAVETYNAKLPDHDRIEARYRGNEYFEDEVIRDFCVWASSFTGCNNADFLRRSAAMAICYEGWITDREACKVVWQHVFFEDEEDEDCDTRVMARELIEARKKTRKSDRLRATANRMWKRYLKDHASQAAAA